MHPLHRLPAFGLPAFRRLACQALVLSALCSLGLPAEASAETDVVRWNQVMLQSIALNPPAPTLVTWRMHLVSSAVYDAWAVYDDVALAYHTGDLLRRPAAERTDANRSAAVSQAFYGALSYVYPNQKDLYDGLMEELGYEPSDSRDPSTPRGIGNLMVDIAIASRLDDGSNLQGGYQQVTSDVFPDLYAPVNSDDPTAPNAPGGPEFDPNHWVPLRVPNGTLTDGAGNAILDHDDPSTFDTQSFLSPHWGAVRAFALESGDQFLPPAPPQRGSDAEYVDALGNVTTNDEAYREQTAEILQTSADLTDEQKVIAEFWADGPRTWTPPGHWNQLAQGLSIRDGHGLGDDVKMYFALNGALHDAAVSSWDAKRRHDYIRPISAIRHEYFDQAVEAWGGPNMGTQTILGRDWQPYQSLTFVTPPFGEFVSGHSTFSRASREVLFAFTGSDVLYDGVTTLGEDYDGDGLEDMLGQHVVPPGHLMFEDGPAETIVLRWDTMLEASDEAGFSRRYGGIHFQDGDLRGREMGRQIGQQAFAHAQALWNGVDAGEPTGSCAPDAHTLCIGDRWEIQATYSTTQGGGSAGLGEALSLADAGVDQGGLFSFFDQDNPELLVKVLDGCAINNHYWVFLAAATNVGYTVQVRDVEDGTLWSHANPDRNLSAAVADVEAHACP